MFIPKTDRVNKIYATVRGKKTVSELMMLLAGSVNMYIDYANIRPWANHLLWHLDVKRLKQFLDSFDNIKVIKFYTGTLVGDANSKRLISEVSGNNYDLRTKPVKIMRFSIDVSSIPIQSTALLNQFIKSSLVRKYDIATIEYLNKKFKEMNARGEFFIEDRKCNFDVEIGRDMLIDHDKNNVDTFVLWSGDSDFAEPVKSLLDDGKKVVLFATTRRVSVELNELRKNGLIIFDIRKLKDFVCWKNEITPGVL